jgi:predicted nucleic acid-binding protein
MILYLDTSALVKLYVRETGSVRIRGWLKRAAAAATSVVAYAEARAAFARLHRSGLTSPRRHRERVARLNADWESYMKIELTPSVLRLAGETAETYELRGFDGIHLASALWLKDRAAVACAFVAFDERLHDGAARAGLPVLP